jgi:uncharacterized membrane protein YhaH (DUF805 family)
MNRAAFWLGLGLLAAIFALLAYFAPQDAQISEGVLSLLCIPRLHDIGRSGWLLLVPLGLELGAVGVAIAFLSLTTALMVFGMVTLVFVALLIWLGCIPGDAQTNRFGDPPAPGLSWRRQPGAG